MNDSSKDLKISVVTVTYNAVSVVEATLRSVLSQTYENIEYILIDGGSSDGTIDCISTYQSRIDKFVTEPDEGIYDAMNKAVELATGDFVIFMNAGDIFHSETSLEEASMFMLDKETVYYGSTVFVYSATLDVPLEVNEFNGFGVMKMPFCHQSVFVPLSIHRNLPFDTEFRLAADYNFFLCSYFSGVSFKKIDTFISNVSKGGVSDTDRLSVYREYFKVNRSFFGYFKAVLSFCTDAIYFYIGRFAKRMVGADLTIYIISYVAKLKGNR